LGNDIPDRNAAATDKRIDVAAGQPGIAAGCDIPGLDRAIRIDEQVTAGLNIARVDAAILADQAGARTSSDIAGSNCADKIQCQRAGRGDGAGCQVTRPEYADL